MMMLAMVAFADPGFSRITDYVVHGPRSPILWFVCTFYGNIGLLVGMLLWDWRQGRLMRQFAFGSAGLMVAWLASWFLYFWPPWRALTMGWVEAWARMTG
jgi:hypothetical protein